jgi:uncharacterized protein (DUF433 family)
MNSNNLLNRIVVDSNIMVGKPVIKGTRLTVELVLGLCAQGMTIEEILQEYPRLEKEDIFACFMFAQQAITNVSFVPLFK